MIISETELTKSQKAMAAAKLCNLAVGSNQYVHRLTHDNSTGEVFSPPRKVAAMTKAKHADSREALNLLEFHAPAINDAVAFALSYTGDMGECILEIGEKWPDLGVFEVAIMDMIVSAVLTDRVAQAQCA